MAIPRKYKYANKRLSEMTVEKGLVADLIKAKLTANAILSPGTDPKVTEVLELESEGIKDAMINFLTDPKLNFTVSELKASVEIEEFETEEQPINVKLQTLLGEYGPIIGFLKNLAGIVDALIPSATPVGDAVQGLESQIETAIKPILQGGATLPAIDARRDGGPSGRLKAVGHAHIGLKDPVPNSDTTDDENDFTKVKLFKNKIPKDLL
tara:strand:+ start:55 stop:684 length:630 start_codon:yes stop_codon:yes gene_type:complete